jgi:hypothetical protein
MLFWLQTDPTVQAALKPIDDLVNGLSAGLLGISLDVAKLAIAGIVISLPIGGLLLLWGAFHTNHSHLGKAVLGRALGASALILLGIPVAYAYIGKVYGVQVPNLPHIGG